MTAPPLGRLVLALDDAMTGADPAMRAALLAFGAVAPVALADQLDAATDDTTRTLGAAAEAQGARRVLIPATAAPAWFRLGAVEALTRWSAGQASTCFHAPHPARPQPIAAAAWKPGLIACLACPHLFRLPRLSAADRRCDGCGRVTTGPEHDDGIHPNSVQFGPLLYTAGACRDCHWGPIVDAAEVPR